MTHLGGWNPNGDNNTYMPSVWQALLAQHPDIRSVVDIGCGAGHNLKWFADNTNLTLCGVEGDPVAVNLAHKLLGAHIVLNDYTISSANISGYHLGICTEFAEHVEAQYEHLWLSDLKDCKYVLFTHALPNQGGHHHVNEQHQPYWDERFAQHGFTPDMVFSHSHRNPHAQWGMNTLILYKK